MARQRRIPVKSFGSEAGIPSVEELASWVADHRGMESDLVTYQLERSLSDEEGVDLPCVGGLYYGRRWRESLVGFSGGVLSGEPGIAPAEVRRDAAQIVARKKGVRFALPAPHLLALSDAYIGDAEEFCETLCELYSGLMREMRDKGVAGHVLVCCEADEIELEKLARRKIVFFPEDPATFDLSSLLEYQREIAVPPERLGEAVSLMEEYRIDRLVILNPKHGDLMGAATEVDPETLLSGGYCQKSCPDYWKIIRDESFILL
jgi:hypothetical protein